MADRVLLDVRFVRKGTGIARVVAGWTPFATGDPNVVLLGPEQLRHSSPDLREPRALRRAVRDSGATLLHAIYPYLLLPGNVPSLLMLHDTLQLDAGPPRSLVFNALIRWNLRATRGVLTVSEAAKATIVDRLDLDPAMIHVAHNGVEQRAAGEPDSARPYALYVGNAKPHKHVEQLLTWAPATLGAAGLRLVAVIPAADHARLAALAPAGVELLSNVGDEELDRLRSAATLAVSLASGEGFGLPPLEAAAHGVPAVLHDAGAHREVAADGACYCTLDRDDFASAVTAALNGRADLSAAALARSRELSWEASWTAARAAQRLVLAELVAG